MITYLIPAVVQTSRLGLFVAFSRYLSIDWVYDAYADIYIKKMMIFFKKKKLFGKLIYRPLPNWGNQTKKKNKM